MKTPEEIKRDMAKCAKRAKNVIMYSCDVEEMAEYTETVSNTLIVGRSLLQQLEQDNAQKDERIRELERELDKARLSFAQQTTEVAKHDRDMLVAVQKAIEKLPRWISVVERLPDESEELVLIVASGRHKNIVFDKALLQGMYYDDSGWIVEGYTEWEDAHVTHWMPLPEPPEEGES